MKFVRIKQYKFENASKNALKNGRVVKFNWFFLKPHKIVDYPQKFYLSKDSLMTKINMFI